MKTRKRYPTDLTDKQWERLKPLLPHKRTAEAKMREYINGILYCCERAVHGRCCRTIFHLSKP